MKLISLALEESLSKTGVLMNYVRQLWENIVLLICCSIQLDLLYLFLTLWIQTDAMSSLTAPIQPFTAALQFNHWKKSRREHQRVLWLKIGAFSSWTSMWFGTESKSKYIALILGGQEWQVFSLISMSVLYSSSQWSYFNKYHFYIIFITLKYKNVTMSHFFLEWLLNK